MDSSNAEKAHIYSADYWAGRASRDAEVEALEERGNAGYRAAEAYLLERDAVRAERDALRTQLDSMTVEWSAPDTGSILLAPFPFGYGTDEEMARRSAAVLHGPVYKRLVSPWTVVEGGDQ